MAHTSNAKESLYNNQCETCQSYFCVCVIRQYQNVLDVTCNIFRKERIELDLNFARLYDAHKKYYDVMEHKPLDPAKIFCKCCLVEHLKREVTYCDRCEEDIEAFIISQSKC